MGKSPAVTKLAEIGVDTLARRAEAGRPIGQKATGLSKSDFTVRPPAAFGIWLNDRSGSQAACAAVPVVRSELAIILKLAWHRRESVVLIAAKDERQTVSSQGARRPAIPLHHRRPANHLLHDAT
jgi:hypothetical protein